MYSSGSHLLMVFLSVLSFRFPTILSLELHTDAFKSAPSQHFQTTCPDLPIFNNCFLQAVQKSALLRQSFTLTEISHNETASGLFYICAAEAVAAGDKRAVYHARLGTRFINGCVTGLTPALMRIYSNTMAKFLKSQGVLTPQNACSMAQDYAKAMEKSSQNVMEKCIPKSKIVALDMAVEDFLIDKNIVPAEDNGELNLIFGLEFIDPNNFKDSPTLLQDSESQDDVRISANQCGANFTFDNNLCNFTTPAINTFISNITAKVNQTYLNVSKQELPKAVFYLGQYYLARQDTKAPAGLSHYLSNVLLQCQNLSSSEWGTTLVKAIAKYLNSEKLLTQNNAGDLAEKFLRNLMKNIDLYVNNTYPESKLVALVKGVVDFLSTIGAFGPEKGRQIIFHMGNEFRCRCQRRF